MEKFYRFENQTGAFICFNEFQSESDFGAFSELVKKSLGIDIVAIIEGPYSITAKGSYNGVEICLMFHEDTGCCIRVDLEHSIVCEEIIKRLSSKPN